MMSWSQWESMKQRIENGEPALPGIPPSKEIKLQQHLIDQMNKNGGEMTAEVLAEIKRQMGRE